MLKRSFILLQHITPQRLLSQVAGWLAESRFTLLKNFLISRFIKHYAVNMQEAEIENPFDYPSFNQFFTRRLKSSLRPIVSESKQIACPVDGRITQIGQIKNNQLLQAKNFYFDLESLLGGDKTLATLFYDGDFCTFYLAPNNYHRVHMPLSGRLEKTIYVPGKLFSVNGITSEKIPALYSRNERLICLFSTDAGPMLIILVGALLVGNIQTIWLKTPIRTTTMTTKIYSPMDAIQLPKGTELGYFNLGSTVITLFTKNHIAWASSLQKTTPVKIGELLGIIVPSQ